MKLSGIGEWLASQIEERTGKEARTTVLGHVQRGGTPTAFDRVLATRFGLNAIAAVKDEAWGTMVALQGTDIVRVPLQAATGTLIKTVPAERYERQWPSSAERGLPFARGLHDLAGPCRRPATPVARRRGVERAVAQLRALPPLVFAGECDLLTERLAQASRGGHLF